MSFFQIEPRDGSSLDRLIFNIKARAQSMDKALPSIAEILVGTVNDVVEAEGPGWPALAPETLMRRRKQGRGAQMLRDSGIMMESLSPGWGADYAEAAFGVPYAIYHIDGAGVPKRDPLNIAPFEDLMFEQIEEILLQNLL